MKEFIITKHIAKSGENSIIIIPKFLKEELKPKTLVKLTLEIIKTPERSK